MDDWRAEMLETVPQLRGASFVRKPYKAYRSDWDHDHCAVCGVKLMETGVEGEDIIHEGFATTSDYEWGEDYEWVCADCFFACEGRMAWTDVTAA